MGLRGPPPKSPKLESQQGFPGRRKAKTKSAIAAADTVEPIQDEPRDSRFVPPVPCVMPRRAKALWSACWSNPALATLLKTTDHGVVARWCVLTYIAERDLKQPPPSTYEEKRERMDADGNLDTVVKIKRNPAYDQMLATMRELRAVEATLGFSPLARLNVDTKLGRKQPEGGAADEGRKPRDGDGPLGILRRKEQQPGHPAGTTETPGPPDRRRPN